MNEPRLPKKNKFVVEKPALVFHCDFGVFPKNGGGSVCYCTGEIEAEFIATALTDWWVSRKGQKWLKNNVLHDQYLKRKNNKTKGELKCNRT